MRGGRRRGRRRRGADEITPDEGVRRNYGAATHYYVLGSVEVGPPSDFIAGVGFDVIGFRRAGAGCRGKGGADGG